MDIAKHPISSVKERYKRTNLNIRDGTKAQYSLIEKGFIHPVTISHSDGWIKLFDITELGRTDLKFSGFNKPISNRKGGVEHQYWMNKVAQDYRNKGYHVEIEKSIGNGKTIDLVASRGKEVIVIEIETGKSDAIENIRKCLDAGYKSVISIATNWETYTKIRNKNKYSTGIEIIMASKKPSIPD